MGINDEESEHGPFDISELEISGISDMSIEEEVKSSKKLISSIRELASSFCSNSEEVRKEVTSMSDGVESMRLELTMSTKEDEDVFKNCIEEIIEEGFTLDTIRNNCQKVKSIIRIDENPEFQKGIAILVI